MIEIQQDISLVERNTLRLDARAEFFVSAKSIEEIFEALEFARTKGIGETILGGGSNVVFSGDVPGLVINVEIPGRKFSGTSVVAGAGENWHQLVLDSMEHGLSGIENLSLIPGCVGAAPIQNIGAYGVELDSVFHSLTAIDRESLTLVELGKSDCGFGYRDSIFKREERNRFVITGVTLNLNRKFEPNLSYGALAEAAAAVDGDLTPSIVSELVCNIRRSKLPDPNIIGNAGSFFKNPVVDNAGINKLLANDPDVPHWNSDDGFKVSAGWLIEQCGLKGYSIGAAAVSPNHALVIINEGSAVGTDILALAKHIQSEVQARFDLALEIEPTLI